MKSTGNEIRAASHYRPLVVVLAAYCGGILVDRTVSWPLPLWAALAAGYLAVWLVCHLAGRHRAGAIVLLLAIGGVGGAWHHCRWSLFVSNDLATFAADEPAPVCVEAVALKGPRRAAPPPFDPMRTVPVGERTLLFVRATAIRDGSDWLPVCGYTTLTVDGQLLGVQAGDRIRVFGTLSRPHGDLNPGGFDQATYLQGSRQLCRLWTSHPDCVSVVEKSPWHGPRWWIERSRTDARRTQWQNLPVGRAELAAALLIGARDEIDPEETNVLVETGTVHLLAISGLHVGIVAGVLLFVLRAVPISRTAKFWIVICWTVAYTLLTDACPPAIRATILVTILCLARLKRRPDSPWNSLAAAGLVVLALNPADLFSTGVQLSFLAVATLMCVSPRWFLGARSDDPLDRLIEQSRGPWERLIRWCAVKVLRLVVACTAVWLVTLPLVASRFHVVSLGSVLLNVVLWIPVTAVLVSGFLMILSGWLLPAGVPVFAAVCNGSLAALQGMIDLTHRLPGNPIWVAGWPDWWLVGFYALLAAAVWTAAHRPRRRCWAWGLFVTWFVVGFVATHRFTPQDQMVCTIVSVGHGAAVVVEMPGGPVILCDAGRMGSPIAGARDIAGCLWSRRIRRIDAITLSHADADHFNAVPELLRRFEVNAVYAPPGTFDGKSGSVRALRTALVGHGVPIEHLTAGDHLRFGEAVVEVLHPPAGSQSEHDNAGSLVLSVEYGGRRIIIPGDVDGEGLEALLNSPPRPCEVLLAPHHGSLKTDAPGLAAWCSPRWVVVSGYYEKRTEPVAEAYRAAGAEVLYAGEIGAVTVRMGTEGITVKPHLGD
ncbi:MAG: DUF4131 domain-containing protein [Planctomycetaceae bacterium]|nr:DUF4131 domain-containing protein [Planctomycetaceae bacterium]